MLEAFQRSAQAEKTRQAEQLASRESSAGNSPSSDGGADKRIGVGGPFDTGTGGLPSPEAPVQVGLEGLRRGLGDDVLGTGPQSQRGFTPRMALLAVGILVAMIVVFQIGRDLGTETKAGSGDDSSDDSDVQVQAKPTQDPSGPAAGETVSPATASSLTEDDLAFLNLENNWTVIAITFDNNESGGKLATETYKYLREQNLPAVQHVTQGKYLTICVGAEPAQNEAIKGIRATLQGLAGPPPRNEKGAFASAYFVQIEDQIDSSLRH